MEEEGIPADACSHLCSWWETETPHEIKRFGVGFPDKIKSPDLTHGVWEPQRQGPNLSSLSGSEGLTVGIPNQHPCALMGWCKPAG